MKQVSFNQYSIMLTENQPSFDNKDAFLLCLSLSTAIFGFIRIIM